MPRPILAATALLALAGFPSAATATWSIVAVDPETREVGLAIASCIIVPSWTVGLVPGRGALVAQALTNLDGLEWGRDQIAAGEPPAAVLARLATSDFDSFLFLPTYELRQYAAVTLDRETEPAHYTGAWTLGWSGARTGYGVSVQGNLLVGEAVVTEALAAFESSRGCGLSERLLRALEAGAREGGDWRCSRDLTALNAVLAVARHDDEPGAPFLELRAARPGEPPFHWARELRRLLLEPVVGTRAENPVVRLRAKYEAWRRDRDAPACETGLP